MSETFDEYRERVLGYLGNRDPLRVQAATPARLERLTRGVPGRVLRRKPARSLSSAQWDGCHGVHDKRGRQSIREFVQMEAAHDLNHLVQIERLLRCERSAGA
jgi:predicted metal-dependent hydrolase